METNTRKMVLEILAAKNKMAIQMKIGMYQSYLSEAQKEFVKDKLRERTLNKKEKGITIHDVQAIIGGDILR